LHTCGDDRSVGLLGAGAMIPLKGRALSSGDDAVLVDEIGTSANDTGSDDDMLADDGTPAVVDGTPAAGDGTPAAGDGTPAAGDGTPAADDGAPEAESSAPQREMESAMIGAIGVRTVAADGMRYLSSEVMSSM
jgi:hypothetical protein